MTTGRLRRCGWFDAVIARYATRVNGLTDLFLTKLDVLSGLERVPVCVAYEIDGERVDEMPMTQTELVTTPRPVYEHLDGWFEPLEDAKTFADLPPNAQAYVRRVEELSGAPVSAIGVGPGRDQTLVLRDLVVSADPYEIAGHARRAAAGDGDADWYAAATAGLLRRAGLVSGPAPGTLTGWCTCRRTTVERGGGQADPSRRLAAPGRPAASPCRRPSCRRPRQAGAPATRRPARLADPGRRCEADGRRATARRPDRPTEVADRRPDKTAGDRRRRSCRAARTARTCARCPRRPDAGQRVLHQLEHGRLRHAPTAASDHRRDGANRGCGRGRPRARPPSAGCRTRCPPRRRARPSRCRPGRRRSSTTVAPIEISRAASASQVPCRRHQVEVQPVLHLLRAPAPR